MARLLRILGVTALILCLVAIYTNGKAIDIPRKKLAGPPSEFQNHILPQPIDAALLEDSAFLEMYLDQEESEDNSDKKKYVYKTDLLIDSDEEFTFSVMSPLAEHCKLKLKDPNGEKVHLKKHAIAGSFPIGGQSVPETTYRFEKPQPGVWKLKMTTEQEFTEEEFKALLPAGRKGTEPHGYLLLWNKSKTRLHTHLNTYNLRLGNKVGLITAVTEDEIVPKGTRPNALKDVVVTADMDIFYPDGTEVEVQLHDDGLHGDLEANDGVYGGSIDATETGVYRASAIVTGTTSSGRAFVRSTQHLIEVVVDEIDLSGVATSSMKDKERLNIHLDVFPDQGTIEFDKLYRTYAEVWGKDATTGADVAVCWIGGLAPVEGTAAQYYLTMELNLKWMALANATGPLTLKNVILQETDGFVPISQFPEVPVSSPSVITEYLSNLPFQVTEITKEMRRGLRTRPLRTNATGDAKLVLVHGYCSGDNPWQKTSHLFTDGIYFLDANANKNNNEFAALVYQFAESQTSAWSMIGHSQGGMIGLHLLSYFESGLDDVESGYRLQSVGTPYQGCSAAGSAASIGTAFGIGCGANDDLATDGANLWLSGIPADIRAEAHYYTTTYEQGKFFGDYCNMAINALLEWPNDGTSEYDYAQLPGGVNMGNTQKQCHTTDMKYDPQYWDSNRNSIMNKNAAR